MVEIPFSKELYLYGFRMRVWNLVVKLKTGTKTNIETIKIVASKVNIIATISIQVYQYHRHPGISIEAYQATDLRDRELA